MLLFFIGFFEMIISTIWTKAVSDTRVIASGVITFINIFIWYYVLSQIVGHLNNWHLVILYALGCALGTVFTTWVYNRRENNREALDLPLPNEHI